MVGSCYDKLYEEAQRNSQCLYAGKKIGIANGQVVVVADEWDEVDRKLEQADSNPAHTFCIDMAQDYKTVQYIWVTQTCPARNGR